MMSHEQRWVTGKLAQVRRGWANTGKTPFYSPKGQAGEIGSGFKDCTRCTAEKYATLQTKWAQRVSKGRKKMSKSEKQQATNAQQGMARCKVKLEAIQHHHHYVATTYLLDNFQCILLLEFCMSEKVQKKDKEHRETGSNRRHRRIRVITVKDMMAYGLQVQEKA